MPLQEKIESLSARKPAEFTAQDRLIFDEFKAELNAGRVRAAEPGPDGRWYVNSWVKSGILLGFRMGVLRDFSIGSNLRFFDKDTYPVRQLTVSDNVRIVPGGSSIRDGVYVAP